MDRLTALADLQEQFFETARRADPATPIPWLDCLEEVVAIMHPRQLRLGRVPPPAARVVFDPAEADASLTLAGAPEGAAEIVIAGSAKSLALLAWGRLGVEAAGIEVRGDRALAAAVLEAGLTP